jgi:hypothetical protein
MTLNDIEQAIIKHVQRVIPGVAVQSFPAKPQDYVLQTANAAVLVRFVEEKPKSEVIGSAGQREVFFDINIVSRDFKGQTGVYTLYDAVRKVLDYTQFGAESGKANGLLLRFRKGNYDNYDTGKGLWFYGQQFSADVPYAPVPTPAINVTQITIADISVYPDNLTNPYITVTPTPVLP